MLKQFLQESVKQAANLGSLARVHAVLGNESCDLDSAVSALVYAFFLQKTDANVDKSYIPVLNIPQSQYRLRTEITQALGEEGITQDCLLFRDTLNLATLMGQEKLELTLVDHNKLNAGDSELEEVVVRVVDHHKCDRTHTDRVSLQVEMVGSCCTLVAETLLQHPDFTPDATIKRLMHGTILLDTVCLAEAAGRTTPKDTDIVNQLEAILGPTDRQAVFDKLQAAKFDVSGLTTMEVLIKDMKLVTGDSLKVAISSVPMHIQDFLSRPDLTSDLTSFSESVGAGVVVVMSLTTAGEDGAPERQIAVYSQNDDYRQKVTGYLCSLHTPVYLSLTPLPVPPTLMHCFTAHSQGNVKASRKVVLPAVTAWLTSL